MLFIFSTSELIRNLWWQLNTAVFLHWCLTRVVIFGISHQCKHCSTKQGWTNFCLRYKTCAEFPLDLLGLDTYAGK
jgi:hypothetical protein